MPPITIYSQPGCMFCVRAKLLLQGFAIRSVEKDISVDAQAKAFVRANGHTTVPQLYVGDKLLFPVEGFEGIKDKTMHEILSRIIELGDQA